MIVLEETVQYKSAQPPVQKKILTKGRFGFQRSRIVCDGRWRKGRSTYLHVWRTCAERTCYSEQVRAL